MPLFLFFNDTATTEIYTLSLHDALPISLIDILTEPKNALVKQFQHLFELDGVEVTFTDNALIAIAQRAIKQKTGARGLRGIIENALLDVMFEIPSSNDIAKVNVDARVINGEGRPAIISKQGKKMKWDKDGKLELDSAA